MTKQELETKLAKLDEITRRLENGEAGLAEAMALYEEGSRILKDSYALLTAYRERAEVLRTEVAELCLANEME